MTTKIYASDTWSPDRVQLEVLKEKHRILQDTMIDIYETSHDFKKSPLESLDTIKIKAYNSIRKSENIDIQYVTLEDNKNE